MTLVFSVLTAIFYLLTQLSIFSFSVFYFASSDPSCHIVGKKACDVMLIQVNTNVFDKDDEEKWSN